MTFPSSRLAAVALALAAVALAAVITVIGLFVLGLSPFAPSTAVPTSQPTSRPTTTAAATPSLAATQQPSGSVVSPSGSPTVSQPPATPSSATDALLAHVPEALRSTCAPASFQQPALALVECTSDGGAIAVSYTLYADQPSMAAVYDAVVIAAGIDDSSGRCYNRNDAGEIVVTTSRWPAENGYDVRDQPVGRYLCYDDGTNATLRWTDDRLYILAAAKVDRTAVDRLVSFWIDEAGPFE